MKYPYSAHEKVQLEGISEALLTQKDHILCCSYFCPEIKASGFLFLSLLFVKPGLQVSLSFPTGTVFCLCFNYIKCLTKHNCQVQWPLPPPAAPLSRTGCFMVQTDFPRELFKEQACFPSSIKCYHLEKKKKNNSHFKGTVEEFSLYFQTLGCLIIRNCLSFLSYVAQAVS